MLPFLRIYLPVYLVLYLLAAFIWPTYRVWKKTGINPLTFGKEDTAHDYIGLVMKLLIGILFVVVLVFSASEKIYSYLLPCWYLESAPVRIAGLVLIHLSLAWILMAQHQMQNSWRIGIDRGHETALVTNGVFAVSRNPVFLGMILSVAGLFLVLPNGLSFFVAAASYIVIQVQIRLEEDFLAQQHGSVYLQYKHKTRRLL